MYFPENEEKNKCTSYDCFISTLQQGGYQAITFHDHLVSNESSNASQNQTNGSSRQWLHPHWQQYDEPPYAYHVTIGCVVLLMLLIAVATNLLAMFVILRLVMVYQKLGLYF
jgi:hypothetical protein